MSEALFFRLLSHGDKSTMLAEAISAVREGRGLKSMTYAVDVSSFRQVPGAPFTYSVSDRIRSLFSELPSFEGEGRTVQHGLATTDDFRFVRAWWEVTPEKILTGESGTTARDFRQKTFAGKSWVPLAKGGAYSPYYADLHLVLNWEQDGEVLKQFLDTKIGKAGQWSRWINAVTYYFPPGLTYPYKSQRGFSVWQLPAGAIFSHVGQSIFIDCREELPAYLGLVNSTAYRGLLSLVTAFGRREVGYVGSIPIPRGLNLLGTIASRCLDVRRSIDATSELSHVFLLPALLQTTGDTLTTRVASWQARVSEIERELAANQDEVDQIVFRLYAIDGEDRRAIEDSFAVGSQEQIIEEETGDGEAEEEYQSESTRDARLLVADLISFIVGCAFGRWDGRFGTGERHVPSLPDPFAPLPVCSPGMLTGPDGLPAREAPPEYPLRVNWDGVLADDPGPDGNSPQQDDVVREVREILSLIWGDRAGGIEKEACEILGVKDLRDWFRNPRAFFDYHIKRYSRSRRKAPIYWLLQSARRSFGLWLYYQRLDKDTLFKVIQCYVEPKIRGEEGRLRELIAQLEATKDALPRREGTRLEKTIETQHELLNELASFKEALQRVVALGYDPDLNDGVVLNIAPLHELVPWREAKKYWDELTAGKYEWSMISQGLRAKGLVHG